MNIRSESHTKVSPKRALSFPLRAFAPSREPLVPQGARRGLIDLARRRKGAKKKMRESDYSKKHTPFKNPANLRKLTLNRYIHAARSR